MAIRPEDVVMGRAGRDALALPDARIVVAVFQGSFKRVCAVAAGHEFLARLPATTPLRDGDVADFHCASHDLILLTR